MLNRNERTYLFIDSHNLFAATRSIEIEIDCRKLLDSFRDGCRLIRARYYTTIYPDQEVLRGLTDWLNYNGYHVVTMHPREYFNEGKRKVKNDMEIELVVDALD